uniref:Secreted protein n=1 Tax=Achlya hypogyna TaxID=1202772 RepID=A0A0A7CNM5_ACHHY|nr:secreted protein [Achlya hypogyna]
MRCAWLLLIAATFVSGDYLSFTKMVSFGDAMSDAGNGAAVISKGAIPSVAYYRGRFSNGPTYNEVIARDLGIPLRSYAVGGATSSDAIAPGYLHHGNATLRVPGLDTQVATYVATSDVADVASTLITLWSGASDEAISDARTSGAAFADAQYDQWVVLAKTGARNLLAVVPPPQTPFLQDYGQRMQANAVVFRLEHGDARLVLYELPALIAGFLLAPASYGFAHGPDDVCCTACMGNAIVCDDPDAYLTWDSAGHPTARVHQLIGADAVAFIKTVF